MEENKIIIQRELSIEDIKNLIYTIRGKQVMLDSDVADMYCCETKYVNRVVKRNIERFPEEFCFQLNEEEFKEQFRKIHSMFLENKQFVNDIYTDIHKNIENINQEVREKTYKYLYCQK